MSRKGTRDGGRSLLLRGLRLYANMPIRAKLLVPFAVLMVIWGGFGTYVLARGTAGEARGRATARLAEALDGGRASFSDMQRALLETVRLGTHTEGVPAAIAARDTVALRRLLEPIAANAGHRLEALDASAGIIIAIAPSGKRTTVVHGGSHREPGIRKAARGVTDARGDKYLTVSSRTIAVAGPVRAASGEAVGAVVVSESTATVAERMARGTNARVSLFSTDGDVIGTNGGDALPYREVAAGLRASVPIGEESYEVLYAPLEARGQRLGTVAVGLPSSEVLGGLQGTAVLLAVLVGFVVLAAVGIGLLTSRAITVPLGSLLDATRSLERGDLDARASIGSRDEVGTLAASFNRMAAELQASHAELERKVAERTVELEQANRELARASAAKSAFLATMSHELRTPLNAIIGFADMLTDPTFGSPTVRTTRELSGNILASGRHLLTVINDVLDLAKVEAGKIDVNPQPIDLAPVAREVESVLSPLAQKKRLALSLEAPPALPRVMADPARLRQVLFNLLANAIKFTPEGGRVSASCATEHGSVVVSVADTGPGLGRGEAERIFEPYERGKASRAVEGAGLGLALARHLVEMQGGRIWVTSAPGKGSTFSFTIPLAADRREPTRPSPGRKVAAAS